MQSLIDDVADQATESLLAKGIREVQERKGEAMTDTNEVPAEFLAWWRKEEGFSDEPYRCTGGALTCWYGHVLATPAERAIARHLWKTWRPDPRLAPTCQIAEAVLRADVSVARVDTGALFVRATINMIENPKAIARHWTLVALCFQLGRTRIRVKFPRFCHAVRQGDWDAAAGELIYKRFRGDSTDITRSEYFEECPSRVESLAWSLRSGEPVWEYAK